MEKIEWRLVYHAHMDAYGYGSHQGCSWRPFSKKIREKKAAEGKGGNVSLQPQALPLGFVFLLPHQGGDFPSGFYSSGSTILLQASQNQVPSTPILGTLGLERLWDCS